MACRHASGMSVLPTWRCDPFPACLVPRIRRRHVRHPRQNSPISVRRTDPAHSADQKAYGRQLNDPSSGHGECPEGQWRYAFFGSVTVSE
jgi:hypothetical protein